MTQTIKPTLGYLRYEVEFRLYLDWLRLGATSDIFEAHRWVDEADEEEHLAYDAVEVRILDRKTNKHLYFRMDDEDICPDGWVE